LRSSRHSTTPHTFTALIWLEWSASDADCMLMARFHGSYSAHTLPSHDTEFTARLRNVFNGAYSDCTRCIIARGSDHTHFPDSISYLHFCRMLEGQVSKRPDRKKSGILGLTISVFAPTYHFPFPFLFLMDANPLYTHVSGTFSFTTRITSRFTSIYRGRADGA
jgi:hypothetical protein